MHLFETILALLLASMVLLQVSRRFKAPYPSVLAVGGVLVALLPWVPDIGLDPHLALALFVSPAMFDAAYDVSPRDLRRHWMPLAALAGVAVLLTTGAVAWVGVAMGGLPIAAAIALGAIVAPPDAAAANAVLSQFDLPRRTFTVLKGESLLNDAVALLLLGGAVTLSDAIPSHALDVATPLLLAIPGGVLLGLAAGWIYLRAARVVAGTLSITLLEFVSTFGVWVLAERLHVSAILAIVAFAMWVAANAPRMTSPRDRIHSYAVWAAAVFVLNVLAFLLMGLQARAIVQRLEGPELQQALLFAGTVVLATIGVRIAWVMGYGLVQRARTGGAADSEAGKGHISACAPLPPATIQQNTLVAWCGMRGVVTLAAAYSLPASFPGRDLIVLSAFAVVLGTLVVQGLTIGLLVRWLDIQPDNSLDKEIVTTRRALAEVALETLEGKNGSQAEGLREALRASAAQSTDPARVAEQTEYDQLRAESLRARRDHLDQLRRDDAISEDAFHRLEEELDYAELDTTPTEHTQMVEG